MKIYTKKGDKGKTSLIGKKGLKKSEGIFELLGGLDELNAFLGTIKAKELEKIQNDLFSIGSIVAGAKTKFDFEKETDALEREIDQMSKKLSPLVNFILPSGDIHLARTVCRRVERSAVRARAQSKVITYLNRLSDYLFVLARKYSKKERIWKI